MFWRRKDDSVLEVPRKRQTARLDAKSGRAPDPVDTLDRRGTRTRDEQKQEQVGYDHMDRPIVRRPPPPPTASPTQGRFSASDGWWLRLLDFYLAREAERYGTPGGARTGTRWAIMVFGFFATILTLMMGNAFWQLLLYLSVFVLVAQVNIDNVSRDDRSADPTELSWIRRLALFAHPSFAEPKGTIRNLILFMLFCVVMVVLT